MILPDTEDPITGPFWQSCASGVLRIQACAACGRRRMPPRPMCPSCRSLDARWDEVSGRATVWSFAVPHPPLLPAYADRVPYAALVVVLDDDPAIRLVGDTAEGVDVATIGIGTPVSVVFEDAGDGVVLPRWRPTA